MTVLDTLVEQNSQMNTHPCILAKGNDVYSKEYAGYHTQLLSHVSLICATHITCCVSHFIQ